MLNNTPTPEVDAAKSSPSTWKADFLASIVVFLVALPLCIGIAIAVGINPARALITGIIGGLIVGWVAGSPLQVSGPAAGLYVIVADLLKDARSDYLEHSDLASNEIEFSLMVMGASVFLAGCLQFVAGRCRLGQWFRAVSPAVVKGMLSGIGVLIFLSQFHVMLDHEARWPAQKNYEASGQQAHGALEYMELRGAEKKNNGMNDRKAHGALEYLATIPEAIGKCFTSSETRSQEPETDGGEKTEEEAKVKNPENHHLAAMIGIVCLICFVFWPKVAPEKISFLPAALVGILIATIFANAIGLEVLYLEIPENVLDEVTIPSKPWLGLLLNKTVLEGALVIALTASAVTLLCATAVDQLHDGPRTKYDQELASQGIGNILCGLVGALPMTGVIVRSSANVGAGAKTRMSTILHGVWLLLFVVAIPTVLTYLPRSALGALLVFTGIKLVNVRDIRKLWKTSRGELLIYLVTVVMIVSVDLLIGVLVGLVLSTIKVTVCSKVLVWPSNLRVSLQSSGDGQPEHLALEGAATFMCLPKLAAELERVSTGSELHIDFTKLAYIDHACLELLNSWNSQHMQLGGTTVADWEALRALFVPQRAAASSPAT